ncbi:hypothetical protein IMSHALPRED_002376 [Imshaugia aleurites]|uniref:AA9 family lytic polysaccharide monooxygenase n=1 Tax=Imshaugia aleurites TaxID=172621 RepID=A0A8H3I525_9LECA|nr:hypothetical protein IMSHALPRED_002376 [Imshaugia aleurites]
MSSIMSILSFSALALLASTAHGHMIMATPPPYGSPDNSPLNADGSNFPCKATSNSGGTVTNMAIGATQKLSFLGESVHGGGSCQVSLTTDTPATTSSKWMVIHSIEGGCPARNQAGNIGADNSASAPDPDTYDFSIPQGIAPGAYTLAWTWFNKVGNREMYMNCASIKVTGASSKRETSLNETREYAIPELSGRATASFPDMFIANIPATDCTTAEGADVKFPDPGASVELASANKADVLTPPTGPKCGASGSSSNASSDTEASNAGSSGASGAAAASSSPAAAPSMSAAAAAAPAVAASPSVAAAAPSVAASLTAASPASPSSAAASAPAAVDSSSGSSAAPAAASGAASTGSSTGSCTTPGQSICSPDGLQIGTCTTESTVTWIPVAAGTNCVGGYMVAAKGKRSAKFLSGYFF